MQISKKFLTISVFKMFRVVAILMLTMNVLSTAIHATNLRLVDLTHTQSADSIVWPSYPQFNFTILWRGFRAGDIWYEGNTFAMPEHSGTHIDAPSHFAEGGFRVHQIPLEKLIGPGVIIDIKTQVASNPNYRVTLDDIQAWETKYNTIPDGAVVFMNAGWSQKYPNKTLVFGSEDHIDTTTFNFPGWHEDTVQWLLDNRNINVIGVDTPSCDYAKSTTLPVHQLLGANNIPGVENVANIDAIPESGTIIYVAAFKLYDGSGSPSRVFATYSDDATGGAPSNWSSKCVIMMMMVILCCLYY